MTTTAKRATKKTAAEPKPTNGTPFASVGALRAATSRVRKARLMAKTNDGEPIDVLYLRSPASRAIELLKLRETATEAEVLSLAVDYLAETLCTAEGKLYATRELLLNELDMDIISDMFHSIITGRTSDDEKAGGKEGNV